MVDKMKSQQIKPKYFGNDIVILSNLRVIRKLVSIKTNVDIEYIIHDVSAKLSKL